MRKAASAVPLICSAINVDNQGAGGVESALLIEASNLPIAIQQATSEASNHARTEEALGSAKVSREPRPSGRTEESPPIAV